MSQFNPLSDLRHWVYQRIDQYQRWLLARHQYRVRLDRDTNAMQQQMTQERGYRVPRWVARVHEQQRRSFGSGNGREINL